MYYVILNISLLYNYIIQNSRYLFKSYLTQIKKDFKILINKNNDKKQ